MIIEIFNVIGIIVFSVAGALKGTKAKLDILGITILGVLTASGGGILRDVLLNRVPLVLENEKDIYLAIIISLISFFLARKIENYTGLIKYFDAGGLAVFTIIGANEGMKSGLGIIGVAIMGTFTGVAGGVLSDILVREVPMILKEDVYALLCIIASSLYWLLVVKFNMERTIVMYIIILFIFISRVIAIHFKLNLPKKT